MNLLPRQLLVKTGPIDFAEWNYRPLLGAIQRTRFRMALGLLGKHRYRRLLEIGYGSGVFMPQLARCAEEIHGIDVHDRATEVSAALSTAGVPAHLCQCSATDTPFESSFFDAIVAVSALEFIDDIEAACREINRILTPAGVLVLVTPGRSPIVDLGLLILTGTSARAGFGDRRQRLLPSIQHFFAVVASRSFPLRGYLGVTLYRALRCERRGSA